MRIVVGIVLVLGLVSCARRAPGPSFTDRTVNILSLEGSAERGAALFTRECEECHGHGGDAGNVRGEEPEHIAAEVLGGNADMPAFDDRLTDAQIADLVAYLRA